MTEKLQKKLYGGSINKEKAQKFVSVLDENLSVKNAPKLSEKNSEDKICKSSKYKPFQ